MKRLHRRRPEPGSRVGQRQGAPPRAREARLARRPRSRRDRDRSLLVRQPRSRVGRAAAGGDRDRGLLHACRGAPREGRLVHEHAAPAAVALPRRSSRSKTAGPSCGSTSTSARRSASSCKSSTGPSGPADPGSDLGLPDERRASRSRAPRRCSREINGWDDKGQALAGYKLLKADGTTACGCWIYCGVFADGDEQAARRKPHWEQSYTALEWAWAWPANRRLLYNRASADPDGKPWSERKQLVWWDEDEERWTGTDMPDFDEEKRPDYVPPDGAAGPAAIRGDHPFIMQADGLGWLYVAAGPRRRAAARRTTSRTSRRSQTRSTVSVRTRARQQNDLAADPVQPGGNEAGAERVSVRTSRPTA